MTDLGMSAAQVKGVGEKTSALLSKLGILTVFDLITHFPRSYEDRSDVREIADCGDGDRVGVFAVLAAPVMSARTKNNRSVTKMIFADDSGSLSVTCFNQPYLRTSLIQGEKYFLFGRVSKFYGKREMNSPVIEKASSHSGKSPLIPVYRLTEGISQNKMRTMVKNALDLLPADYETLNKKLIDDFSLISFSSAVRKIHFPSEQFDINLSRERLIFEELFILRSGILRLKARLELAGKSHHPLITGNADEFIKQLPFTLTDAQNRVISECLKDTMSGKRLSRLIQGDVGSGKTAVASAVAYAVCRSGGQAAFMAPTEILAEQHYRNLSALFAQFGIKVALLTGATPKKDRSEILSSLSDGSIGICVGTHALLTPDVTFANLSLVIADEQHRFGVMQRAALSEKGKSAHILVMSATPIPRTVGLIIYGGLDISVIDELPAGRQKVTTMLISSERRSDAYGFAAKELASGNKMYVVCPAIEDDGISDTASVTELYKELSEGYLKGFRVLLLHGKMKPKEKNSVMQHFYSGDADVIVSTTVIEVGIDSPDATLMYIEDADRFGLSQLHQLRGRVGRGKKKSYCVLISDSTAEKTRERLETVRDNCDGFKLMEYDFAERGPGDFFGKRQHGLPSLKIADLAIDVSLLDKASDAAGRLFSGEYFLTAEEKNYMKSSVERLFSEQSSEIFS